MLSSCLVESKHWTPDSNDSGGTRPSSASAMYKFSLFMHWFNHATCSTLILPACSFVPCHYLLFRASMPAMHPGTAVASQLGLSTSFYLLFLICVAFAPPATPANLYGHLRGSCFGPMFPLFQPSLECRLSWIRRSLHKRAVGWLVVKQEGASYVDHYIDDYHSRQTWLQ